MELFITRLNKIDWENISKNDINHLIAEFDALTPCTSLSAGFEMLLETQSRYSQSGQKRKADYIILILLAAADVELRLRDRSETDTRSMICNAVHRSLELSGRERTLSEEAMAVRQATRLFCQLQDKLQASFLQRRAFEIPFHVDGVRGIANICRYKASISNILGSIEKVKSRPREMWNSEALSIPYRVSYFLSHSRSAMTVYTTLGVLFKDNDPRIIGSGITINQYRPSNLTSGHLFISLSNDFDFSRQRRHTISDCFSLPVKKTLYYKEVKDGTSSTQAAVYNFGYPESAKRYVESVRSILYPPVLEAFPAITSISPTHVALMKLDEGYIMRPESGSMGVLIPVFDSPVSIALAEQDISISSGSMLLSPIDWQPTEAMCLLQKGFRVMGGNTRFIYLLFSCD